MKKYVLAFGFLLVNAAAFVSCNQDEQNPNPVSAAKQGSIVLSGRILNENGQGLAGASIIAGGKSFISSTNGIFRIEGISKEDKLSCLVSAPGFQDKLVEICDNKGEIAPLEIKLQTKTDCNTAALCHLDVNGDGFKNETLELGNLPAKSIGIYSADGKSTYFSMSSKNGHSIAGVFPGNMAGITSSKSSMTLVANGKTYVADSGVKITVKEYGGVGKKIKGSFSGIFSRYDVNLKTGKHLEFTLEVRNGSFEVIRSKDL